MWPTHDFLENLFNYKIFVGSSYVISCYSYVISCHHIILINKKYVKFELFEGA
ncbi:hypothetical protein O3M35_002717 [Rhynocoris fuscipes]|uniref:Uncharacterized protein n=1 Tax=Rhynocoris fuscipes TaxID=488301 RepID=A0AAW1CL94_9HEMI